MGLTRAGEGARVSLYAFPLTRLYLARLFGLLGLWVSPNPDPQPLSLPLDPGKPKPEVG